DQWGSVIFVTEFERFRRGRGSRRFTSHIESERLVMSLRSLMFSFVALGALAVGGTLALAPFHAVPESVAQTVMAEPQAQRVVPESDAQVKLSFAPVVQAVSPSVVNVYATRIEQQVVSPFANDPFFSRFFGEQT